MFLAEQGSEGQEAAGDPALGPQGVLGEGQQRQDAIIYLMGA